MGYWVNKSTYSPGKRHYFPDGATQVIYEYETPHGVSHWTDRTWGKSLCGAVITNSRRTWTYEDKPHESGGLSYREESEVKLTQGNLCWYCKTEYIKARPELEQALKALGVI